MRSAHPIASLLGSLGLHACAVLLFVLAARKPPETAPPVVAPRDAWQGSGAVEVDALATEGEPNLENTVSSEPQPQPQPAEPAPTEVPAKPVAPEATEPAPPKPRPRAPRKPKPAAVAAAESNGSHDANTQGATGSFGSADLPPGVRSLPSAFTRAIPPASGADPIWQSLPVGTLRPFTLAVRVDAEGHIASTQVVGAQGNAPTPEHVEHLRQRVIALLGGGLFALQNQGAAGSDLFRITITLSDRGVKEDSEPAELVERGFEPPRLHAPGRAYFTLASGRHFEAKVEVLGSPSGRD